MESAIPSYICKKVAPGSVIIDGELSDIGWADIESVGNFILADGSDVASRTTEAKMAWDDEFLYICFRCVDQDIWGTMYNRDEPIYEEEVVEAFIDPDSDMVRYYEFQISPRGVVFDAKIENPGGIGKDMILDTSWDCEGWLSAVRVDGTLDDRTDLDKEWIAEWAIPFTSLIGAPNTPPKNGDTWRINLYRIDRTPSSEFSCWSPTLVSPANYHVPARFGKIIFQE